MPIFNKNGKIFEIEMDEFESIEHFNLRIWFISNTIYTTNFDFGYLITLSKILVNINYLECSYNSTINNVLSEILNQIKCN